MRYRKKHWTKKLEKYEKNTVNMTEYKEGNYFKDRMATVFNIKFHFDKYYSILPIVLKWIDLETAVLCCFCYISFVYGTYICWDITTS